MSRPIITVIGMGPGSLDAMTVGSLRRLHKLSQEGVPIYARTFQHPSVEPLRSEGIRFVGSFDSEYERAADFRSLYKTIAQSLVVSSRAAGQIAYAVPGHARIAEQSVAELVHLTEQQNVGLEFEGGSSFIDAALHAVTPDIPLKILDALDLIRRPGPYEAEIEWYDARAAHYIIQVYDQAVASDLKLVLLEVLPPESQVALIRNAGLADQTVSHCALSELDRSGIKFDHLSTLVIPRQVNAERLVTLASLLDIMARLRNPDGGCPWDVEQTPQSLGRFLLEESYEVIAASAEDDPEHYAEELGDVLLQVIFHAQIAREAGKFNFRDVLRYVIEKLVRRHPHVFGDTKVSGSEEVLRNWNSIKAQESGRVQRESVFAGIPSSLPALMLAQEVSKRAAATGFEWETIEDVFAKLTEEVEELRTALADRDADAVASEVGDLLFTAVNVSRFCTVDAETALIRMVSRFRKRFQRIEEHAASLGVITSSLGAETMNHVWVQAKKELS